MKFKTLRTMAYTALAATTLFTGAAIAADSVTVPVNATVANSITMTIDAPMEFGTIIAINEAGNTGTIALNTADTLGTPSSTGGNAKIAAVSGTPTSGAVSVTGVSGVDIELQITNVVDPTDGTDTLTLDQFTYLLPSGSETSIAEDTVFTLTASGSAQAVAIGASLTTPDQATLIGDNPYVGSFDLVASY